MKGKLIGLMLTFCLLACGSADASIMSANFREILLGKGTVGRYSWEVGISRDGGRKGGRRPCIGVAMVDPKPKGYPPGFSHEIDMKVCSALGARKPPNIVSISLGEGKSEGTAIGVAVSPSVKSVRLDLSGGHVREIQPKLLNRKQMTIAGVAEAKYAALDFYGRFCLRDLVTYGEVGEVLFQGPPEDCSE